MSLSITGDYIVTADQTLTFNEPIGIRADGDQSTPSASLTNYGTIRNEWDYGPTAVAGNLRFFRNYGTVSVKSTRADDYVFALKPAILETYNYGDLTAEGYRASGGTSGGFENNGRVNVTGQLSAVGFSVVTGGMLRNTNSIVVHATGVGVADTETVQATGFIVASPLLEIVNSGSIMVSATGPSASSTGIGFYHFTSNAMTINNSGLIVADWAVRDWSDQAAADHLINTGSLLGQVDLGAGNDVVTNSGLITGTIYLGRGDDTYDGANQTGAVIVDGQAGNDTLIAGMGDDILSGGDGNDTIHGGGGNDILFGGDGDDALQGGAGDDIIDGGAGSDTALYSGAINAYTVSYETEANIYHLTDNRNGSPDGSDTLISVETVTFGDGSGYVFDTGNVAPWAVVGTVRDARGSIQSQTVAGDHGTYWVNQYDTDNSQSWLWMTSHYDAEGRIMSVVGTRDDGTHWVGMSDTANTGGWASAIYFYSADWRPTGSDSSSDLNPSVSADAEAQVAFDNLVWFTTPYDPDFTSPGVANRLVGGDGADVLYGFGGDDLLAGGQGNDVLVGGSGADRLAGGTGADRFVFSTGSGEDIIADFAPSQGDVIDLRGFGIASFAELQPLISTMGQDTFIALNEHDSIRLQELAPSALSSSDFLFS